MAGGTTAVIKAGAISKMAKIGSFFLSWSNIVLAIVLNDSFKITVLKSAKTAGYL